MLLAFLGYYALRQYGRITVNTSVPTPTPLAAASPTPTPDPLRPFGVLLLGFGGPDHDGGYLTDTIIIAHVQPRQQTIDLISVPRDLWVQLPIEEGQEPKGFKVNAAYAIGRDDRRYPRKPAHFQGEGGGGALAKSALSEVTGLPIEYFIALSFDGFIQSIDTLGGVTVQVPVTFDDYLYPISGKGNETCGRSPEELAAMTATLSGQKLEQAFECRYEHLHFDAGKQVMDGTTAHKFVRSRHSPQHGGDFARSQRQQALLQALRTQIFQVGFVSKAIPFTQSLTADMQTDIPLRVLQTWLNQAEEYKGYDLRSIALTEQNVLKAGTSSDRHFILMPKTGMFDWTSIQEFLANELQPASE